MVPYSGYRVFIFAHFVQIAYAGESWCLGDNLDARCESGDVIVMDTAQYGRMRSGPCDTSDKDIGCAADVLSVTDSWCTGKSSCRKHLYESLFRGYSDCPTQLGAFLETSYSCHKELTMTRQQCSLPIAVPEARGTFLLSTLLQNECALSHAPLTLQAQSGQRFNITMIDASLHTSTHEQNACPLEIGHIIDRPNSIMRKICGGKSRLTHLVLSNGNSLEFVVNRGILNPNIVFQYEVLGCADLDPVDGARMRRQDNKVTVTCVESGREWELTCEANKWVGTHAECNKGSPYQQPYKEDGQSGVSVSREMVVIVTGVVTLCASAVIVFAAVIQLYRTLGCHSYIARKRKGYGLPPEFPSEEEYYDGQELPMRSMQPMSDSFIQINRPQLSIPSNSAASGAPSGSARTPGCDSPSPTVMTLNSQYENMSTMSSKGAVYEPLELRSAAGQSINRQRAPSVQSGRANAANPRPEPVQTPVRQKYKGFAHTLKLRTSKARKGSFRKSAPVQPPRVSSLLKQDVTSRPAPRPVNTPQSTKRSKRDSTSAPVRRMPTPPPSPGHQPAVHAKQATEKGPPTYSVPMRNSMLQSEVPDVVYQTTEASFGPTRHDEDTYEVPVKSRDSTSASGTSGSSGGSTYAPVRISDALTSYTPPANESEDECVYSGTQEIRPPSTRAPKASKPPPKLVIKEPEVSTDPDVNKYIDLDLSKPMVIDVGISKSKPAPSTPSAGQGHRKVHVHPADESVYANVSPKYNNTFNSSDYGALCDHSSNRPDADDTEDVYACAKEYYVQDDRANRR